MKTYQRQYATASIMYSGETIVLDGIDLLICFTKLMIPFRIIITCDRFMHFNKTYTNTCAELHPNLMVKKCISLFVNSICIASSFGSEMLKWSFSCISTMLQLLMAFKPKLKKRHRALVLLCTCKWNSIMNGCSKCVWYISSFLIF